MFSEDYIEYEGLLERSFIELKSGFGTPTIKPDLKSWEIR